MSNEIKAYREAVNAALTDAAATNDALRTEIMSVNRELAQAEIRANYHANRVVIIEEERAEAQDAAKGKAAEAKVLESLLAQVRDERDAYKRDLDAELTGNAALRRDFGARPDETMCEFVARLVRERDEALSRSAELPAIKRERDRLMAGACAICATCEGPLTCAKCVPVKPPGIALFDDPNIVRTVLDDLDDLEARLKALEHISHVHDDIVAVYENAEAAALLDADDRAMDFT